MQRRNCRSAGVRYPFVVVSGAVANVGLSLERVTICLGVACGARLAKRWQTPCLSKRASWQGMYQAQAWIWGVLAINDTPRLHCK